MSAIKGAGGLAALAKTGTLLSTGLSALLNPTILVPAAALAAISAVTMSIGAYQKKIEDMRREALESAAESSEAIDSLDDYADKVEQLRTSLASGNLSESEAYETKKQLLDIQNQLNETYGDSASGIDLVNGKLDEQIAKIKELTASQATNWLNTNYDIVKEAEKAMTKSLGDSSWGGRHGFIGSFIDNQHASTNEFLKILDKYSDYIEVSDRLDATGYSRVTFVGNVLEAKTILNDFMTDLRAANGEFSDNTIFENFLSGAKSVYDYADGIIQNNQEIVETAMRYRLIEESYGVNEKTYSADGQEKTAIQWLDDYTNSVEKYNNALLSGDSGSISDARSEFEKLDGAIRGLIENDSDFAYFTSLFNDVRAALDESSISVNEFGDRLNRIGQQTNWLKDNQITDTEFADSFISGLGSDKTSKAVETILRQYAAAFGTEFTGLTTDQVEWVANYLVEAGILVGNAVSSATETASVTLDTVKESFDSVIDTQDKLRSAFESSSSAAGMNADEVNDVVEAYKKLGDFDADKLFETSFDGVHMNTEVFEDYRKQLEDISRQKLIDQITSKYQELNKAREDGSSDENIANLEKELSIFQLYLDVFDSLNSEYTNISTAMTNAMSMQDSLSDAFESSASGAALTADQIQNIVLAFRGLDGFDIESLFAFTGDGVRLNLDVFRQYNDELKKLDKSKLESVITAMETDLASGAVAEADIPTIKAQLALYKVMLNSYEGMTNGCSEFANAISLAEDAQSNLNDAFEASQNYGGLSTEQIQNVANAFKDLSSYDPSTLFVKMADGVHLNEQAFGNLNDELKLLVQQDLLNQIESVSDPLQKALLQSVFDAYTASTSEYATLSKVLSGAETAQSNLNDAFEASQSAAGMNAEQIQNVISAFSELEGFDAVGLFEMTTNGVRMNTKAFKEYNAQLQANTKAQFQNQIQSKQNEIKSVEAGDDSDKSLETLYSELESLKLLSAVYDGMTSAYSRMSEQVATATTRQEVLSDALAASSSETGLSIEQIENVISAFSDLADFDSASLFETTATGVRLNTQAFEKYNEELQKQTRADLLGKIALKEKELASASEDQRDAIQDEIDSLKLLANVYEGFASDYSKFTDTLTRAKEVQSNLTDAYSASNSATGMTADQIQNVISAFEDLEGFDLTNLFETTANGVRMNTEAFAQYNEQLQNTTRKNLLEKIIAKQKELDAARGKHADTTALENELNLYMLLANEYDGLTSKYNQYVSASSSANSRDSLENVAGGYEAVGKLISQGWVTDDSVTSYLDLLLGTDRVQDSIDAYEQLGETIKGTNHSLKDYMTYDEDGNFTSQGAWDFVNDVRQLMGGDYAGQDENGNWFLDLTGEKLQDVADRFKTTTDYVELLGKALADAGMEVNFDSKDIQDYRRELAKLNEEANTAQKELQGMQDKYGGLLDGVDLDYDKASMTIDEIDSKVDELGKKKAVIEADMDADGAEEAIGFLDEEINALTKQKVMLSIGAAIEDGLTIEQLIGLSDTELQTTLNVDASQVETARAMLESLASGGEVTVPVVVQIEEGQFAALTSSEGTANYSLGEYPTEVPDVSGTANYSGVFPTSAPTISGTVVYSGSFPSRPKASGSMLSIAHADGTAYNALNYTRLSPSHADGRVSLPSDEFALTNEIGRESIVRDGVWYLLPPGPHMEHLKKGDIIFNAQQTQDLLSAGKTFSYAKSYAYGTIPLEMGGGFSASGKNPWDKIPTTTPKDKGGSDSNKTQDTEDTEKVDWIERFFKKLKREIDKFRSIAESTFKSLSSRLSAASHDISKITEEIDMQAQAYARYMQEAESVGVDAEDGVGLSEDIKQLIRDGSIDIGKYNKETQELISEYQEWYDKAQEAADTIDELHEEIAQFYQDSFNNIQSHAESQIKMIDHMTSMYETQIEILSEQGYMDSAAIYGDLMDAEMQRITRLQKEREDLQSMFDSAMASGEIEEESEAWYEMLSAIDDVDEAIQESTLNLVKYGNTIQQIHWDYFDYLQESISNVISEADFLIDLLEGSELFDENGLLNDSGNAVAGLHAQNYNTYMAKADNYAKEIRSLDAEIANDPNNQTLIERRQELLELQQKSIKSAEDEKKAIVDLAEDGISAQIDAMSELIDKYEESLDSARDLYDYQKKVSKQSKNIANIEKQLAAYQGNSSEETRATIQKLKEELESAQEDLQDTEYKQYISDQKKMLDDLLTSYEETLNSRMDDIDGLLNDMIGSVNDNSGAINDTIVSAANKVGYTLSDNIGRIWSRDGLSLDGVVSYYGDDFGEKLTSTNNILGNIYAVVSAMISASDEVAVKKYANGGIVNYTGLAQLDGSPKKPEIVLDQEHAQQFTSLMHTLEAMSSVEFSYGAMTNIGNVGFTGIADISDLIRSVSGQSGSTGNVDVGGIEINIPIDHVQDYDDFVSMIQKDKRFEEMITAMTVNKLAGGSKFGKYNYSWNK